MQKYLLFLLIISLLGCSKNIIETPNTKPDPPTLTYGDLTIEDFKEAISKEINTNGGEVIVPTSNPDVPGLSIQVPSGSYPTSKTFKISTAKITKHQLGENFNPISPLIRVDNGGDFSSEEMIITIPIKLPKDHFALVFVFDNETRLPTFLPTLFLSQDKIVVTTTSFSKNILSKSGRVKTGNDFEVVVSSIPEGKLSDEEVHTGFVPGFDDWEFPNIGTPLTPKGNCTGMVRSALYYYENIKPITGKPLHGNSAFGRYFIPQKNSFDKIWFDNRVGFRFVTVIQGLPSTKKSEKKESTVSNNGEPFKFDGPLWDKIIFNSVKYYYKVKPYPLYLTISSENGNRHMILIIGINSKGIIVADPKKPGMERIVEYIKETGFNDYDSDDNKNNNNSYNSFSLHPTWYWDILESRNFPDKYAEVKKGTIGNDVFESPKKFYVVDTEAKSLKLLASGLDIYGKFGVIYDDENGKYVYRIYDKEGNKLHRGDNYQVTDDIVLEKGEQTLGILTLHKAANGDYDWSDFEWFDINIHDSKTILYFSYELNDKTISLRDDGSIPFKTALIRFTFDKNLKQLNIFGNQPGVSYNNISIWGITEIKAPMKHNIFVKYNNTVQAESGVFFSLGGNGIGVSTGVICSPPPVICETPGFLQIEKFDGEIIEGTFEFNYFDPYAKVARICKNGKFRAKYSN